LRPWLDFAKHGKSKDAQMHENLARIKVITSNMETLVVLQSALQTKEDVDEFEEIMRTKNKLVFPS
jgi:hypothetical protein